MELSLGRRLVPFSGIALLVTIWHIAITSSPGTLLPSPWAVVLAIVELARKGLLVKHIIASLFRVSWGWLAAVAAGIPIGTTLGWYRRFGGAVSPLLEVFRPISPLAWIPIAILWFGVGDSSAIFIIFLASFLPITVASMHAVGGVTPTHVNAGLNFGLNTGRMIRRVILPSVMPQLIVALRLTLGIAWLVVVAAEMIAVRSGLGFLVIDARNAGDRYDVVVAGMVLIGLVGLGLDLLISRLSKIRTLAWAAASSGAGAPRAVGRKAVGEVK